MNTLESGYCAHIDQIKEPDWSRLLERFADATLYQTWSYGAVRWRENNLSHIVLKKDDEIVAATQSRIVKLPFIRGGIAYIPGGPMWRVRGRKRDFSILRQMCRLLHEEYVIRRGLFLRIIPREFETAEVPIRSIFETEGLRWRPHCYRTLLLDLSPSLESVRRCLRGKWRNHLNRSEKNRLKIFQGTDIKLYDAFISIYNEMLSRKRFATGLDIHEFRLIQEQLPDGLKMKIVVCEFDGAAVSAFVASAIGDMAITIFRATNKIGYDVKASYLSYWHMIQLLKESGCRYCDQGGIDPDGNPGVYHFKAGLGGYDVFSLGQFEAYKNFVSFLLVKGGEQLTATPEQRRIALNKLNRINCIFQRSGK